MLRAKKEARDVRERIVSKILQPKYHGLTSAAKPCALILHSRSDVGYPEGKPKRDMAINYEKTVLLVKNFGYGMINRSQLMFENTRVGEPEPGVAIVERLSQSIKPGLDMRGKCLTIWFESHGAPGWLFGDVPTARSEMSRMVEFAKFIHQIERFTGAAVENIVLLPANQVIAS